MFDAGEVRLGREGEEFLASRPGLIQQRLQPLRIEAQTGHYQRRIIDTCSLGARKLAHSIDRVVIIKSQQQAALRCEWKGLAHQLEPAEALAVKTSVYSSGEALK